MCQTGLIGIPFPIDAVMPEIAPIVMARDGGPEAGGRGGARHHDHRHRAQGGRRRRRRVHRRGHGQGRGDARAQHGHHAGGAARPTRRWTPGTLQQALAEAVAASFNAITVDGCTSTNDTVLVLASGLGSRPVARRARPERSPTACRSLAEQMVDDAEGATKVAHVYVRGARERRGRARGGAQGGGLHARAVLPLR